MLLAEVLQNYLCATFFDGESVRGRERRTYSRSTRGQFKKTFTRVIYKGSNRLRVVPHFSSGIVEREKREWA